MIDKEGTLKQQIYRCVACLERICTLTTDIHPICCPNIPGRTTNWVKLTQPPNRDTVARIVDKIMEEL